MDIQIFRTLWGFEGEIITAFEQAKLANFDGIEGPAPSNSNDRQQFADLLQQFDLAYIAEITTAGSYVPNRHATPDQHLASLREKLQHSIEQKPLFITCLAGCDAWPEDVSVDFFKKAIAIADEYGVLISFETHRSRSMFNPWVTERIVEKIPDIKLTADFSHWCVVCERLMDSEIDTIYNIASNIHHIHARVGYDQGPQVPHPAAPEYEYALRAHQAWWRLIWHAQFEQGYKLTTLTPEFGPDGYLQQQPFTKKPVADLWEINQWMAEQQVEQFNQFINE